MTRLYSKPLLALVLSLVIALDATAQTQTILSSQADFLCLSDSQVGSIIQRKKAIEVNCVAPSSEPWRLQIQSPPIAKAIRAQEVLCLRFDAVCVPPNTQETQGKLLVYFQQTDNYQSVAAADSASIIVPTSNRNTYFACVRAKQSYKSNSCNVTIHCAENKQHLEITNLSLISLGDIPEREWPRTKLVYEPSASDLQIVQLAKSRINAVRKSNLKIRVLKADGTPVANAKIQVEQQRHKFAFGSFTDAMPLTDSADADRYRATMKQLFNRVTLPRYWADWGTDSPNGKAMSDNMAHWAASEGFELKTHLLLYPTFIPKRVRELRDQPKAFRREIDAAISDALERTSKFPMVAWDGINEVRDDNILAEVLGKSFYTELFKTANASQPSATWFINEYGILAANDQQDENIAQYENLIRRLLDEGAAVEGIGMQGHFQGKLTSMSKAQEVLDRFAQFGLPIEVTEFDIDSHDEETQAAYTRDILTLVFSHPATTGFTTWGFWEGSMWRPSGAMFRKDWTIKPNGKVWEELVYNEWWTDETTSTDAAGVSAVKAFHGKHRVTIRVEGKFVVRDVDLGPEDLAIDVYMDM